MASYPLAREFAPTELAWWQPAWLMMPWWARREQMLAWLEEPWVSMEPGDGSCSQCVSTLTAGAPTVPPCAVSNVNSQNIEMKFCGALIKGSFLPPKKII